MYPVLRKCLTPIVHDLNNLWGPKVYASHFNVHCSKTCTRAVACLVDVDKVKAGKFDRFDGSEAKCPKADERGLRSEDVCLLTDEDRDRDKEKETDFVTVSDQRDDGVMDDRTEPEDMCLATESEGELDEDEGRRVESSSPVDDGTPAESRRRHITEEIKRNMSWIRWTEYSSYAKDLIRANRWSSVQNDLITVVSYNVLSQTLLEKHRYLYRRNDEWSLRWDARSRVLLEEFAELNADVLCLQEVDSTVLNSFYNYHLNRLGYQGVYKQRTNDKVDGCAIYYKRDKFTLVKDMTVELFKRSVQLLDRDNIGIILRLSLKSSPSVEVVVATTHLLYNPRRGDIKLAQTQVMLAEIEKMAYVGHNSLTQQPEYLPIIFTGDMNYPPENGVYQLVTKSYLEYEGMSSEKLVPSLRGHVLNKTLLPPGVGVTDSCQYASSLTNREGVHEVSYSTGALDHRLNLASVYDHVKSNLPEATTNQNQWLTVDYIFYSQLWNDELKLRTEGNLRLISRLTLPNSQEAEMYLRYLPNLGCASDHLPLLATFQLLSNR